MIVIMSVFIKSIICCKNHYKNMCITIIIIKYFFFKFVLSKQPSRSLSKPFRLGGVECNM